MTNNNNYDGILPHNTESYWTSSIQLPEYPSLENDMQVNVIIVGGTKDLIVYKVFSYFLYLEFLYLNSKMWLEFYLDCFVFYTALDK
ncbi:hypothetical protein COL82_16380 [Bacillus toyonensis]|nr:hypothetical protein COL82_16380 [Bacillus toyonensis]PGA03115.1 hypothetical protein COL67_25780 [Bacillus toyonensis]